MSKTFGQSIDSSSFNVSMDSNHAFVNRLVLPEAVKVNSINANIGLYAGYDVKLIIWDQNYNVVTGSIGTVVSEGSFAWETHTYTSPLSLSAGTYYIGAIAENSSVKIAYASGGSLNLYYEDTSNSYTSPNSLNLNDADDTVHSLYLDVDYTEDTIIGHADGGGGNLWGLSTNDALRTKITPTSAIKITKMYAYTGYYTGNIKFVIWDSNDNVVTGSVSSAVSTSATWEWVSHEYTTPISLSAGTYYLGWVADGVVGTAYDQQTLDYGVYDTGNSYSSPNSFSGVTTTRQVPIYAEIQGVPELNKIYSIPIASGLTKLFNVSLNNISKFLTIAIPDVVYGGTNGQRGVFGGGYTGTVLNVIDYVTINTAGNATDFGDLTTASRDSAGASNGPYDRAIVQAGGFEGTYSNRIQYVTISTTGNAADFGDLTSARRNVASADNGAGNIALFGAGYSGSYTNAIDYINISTTGNAADFGDSTQADAYMSRNVSNDINNRGVFMGGYDGAYRDTIEYVTINTKGNATDFGNTTVGTGANAGSANGTSNRGILAGKETTGGVSGKSIDYITITTPGNALDFGDLITIVSHNTGVSNKTDERGLSAGGFDRTTLTNTIEYVTINSPGNGSDFGDLTVARRNGMASSSNSGYTGTLYFNPITLAGTGDRCITSMAGTLQGNSNSDVIDYVTISTTGNSADFGDATVSRRICNGLSNGPGNVGIGGGGYVTSGSNIIDFINITSTMDAVDFGDLTVARWNLVGVDNGVNNRGIFAGGLTAAASNVIDYITISTPGNATDFGDLTTAKSLNDGGTSNDTNERGVFCGSDTYSNVIEYITISNTGNGSDFGDLTDSYQNCSIISNGTNETAVVSVGRNSSAILNIMEYFDISTPSNASDFGDLTEAKHAVASNSNKENERGLFNGGYTGSLAVDTIEYITINTPGNGIDFGDLTVARYSTGSFSNAGRHQSMPGFDRGVFHAGAPNSGDTNTIDYITISSPSNALDFGDAAQAERNPVGTSNSTNNRGTFNGGATVNIINYLTISIQGNSVDFGDLVMSRNGAGALSNGTNERAVVAGNTSYTTPIDYYTISTTGNAADFGDMVAARHSTGATSNATNERGVWMGGTTGSVNNRIDYVTISTTGNAADFGDMTVGSYSGDGGFSNGTNERGVRGPGGSVADGNWGAVFIDYITLNSTGNAADFGDDVHVRSYYAFGTDNKTGEVGVIAGGHSASNVSSNAISKVTINSTGNAVDFGDLTVARRSAGATSNA